jgi:two-component system, LytTR family, response regulator
MRLLYIFAEILLMTLNTLIIEDDLSYREYLIDLLQKIPNVSIIGGCADPAEATSLLSNGNIHLIISDIEMGEISGLDFIRSLNNAPMIIFITSFPSYALEGFDVNAIDYLVKPVTLGRLLKAVNKAHDQFIAHQSSQGPRIQNQNDHFFIRTDSQYVKLNYEDVIYIEAYGDFVKIYTLNSHVIALVNLKNIEDQLPQTIFMRVHRSYIINISKIERIDNSEIIISTYTIPVSKAYRDKVYASVVGAKLVKRFNDDSDPL